MGFMTHNFLVQRKTVLKFTLIFPAVNKKIPKPLNELRKKCLFIYLFILRFQKYIFRPPFVEVVGGNIIFGALVCSAQHEILLIRG